MNTLERWHLDYKSLLGWGFDMVNNTRIITAELIVKPLVIRAYQALYMWDEGDDE